MKSKETIMLAEAIATSNSLKRIELKSTFLIHEYSLLIEGISRRDSLQYLSLDLTNATDIVNHAITVITNNMRYMIELSRICLIFEHERLNDSTILLALLQAVYSHQPLTHIKLSFPLSALNST